MLASTYYAFLSLGRSGPEAEEAKSPENAQNEKLDSPPVMPLPSAAVASRGPSPAEKGTKKLYLEDTYLAETVARVLEVNAVPDSSDLQVVLDQTVFHPQGGGQPADKGVLAFAGGEFRVTMVREDRSTGIVFHFGSLASGGPLAEGLEVRAQIDPDWRRVCSRLHSAGHAMDAAMTALAVAGLKPTKGYHFPDAPFVEYAGTLASEVKEALPQQLTKKLQTIIDDQVASQVVYLHAPEVLGLCPDADVSMFPEGSLIRVVNVGGCWCPCGGTHIANASELGKVTVTRIKAKKGMVKVSYEVAGC